MAESEEETYIKAGTVLFNQGDPGGDLYFIREGRVEVYTEQDSHETILTLLEAGEVLGLLTCVTAAPRMASARAQTDIIVRHVPHARLQRVLSDVPDFLRLVIKEFSARVADIDRKYGEARAEIESLSQSQASTLYTGSQMASALSFVGEAIARTVDERKVIVAEEALDRLENILVRPKKELRTILGAFLAAGLLRLEIEPDRKQKVVSLDAAKRLAAFTQFVTSARAGKTKKLLKEAFSYKDRRLLLSLVKYAKAKGMDVGASVKLTMQDPEYFSKITGEDYRREVFERAAKVSLVTLMRQGQDDVLMFSPATLSLTLACVHAYRQLETGENDAISEEKAS